MTLKEYVAGLADCTHVLVLHNGSQSFEAILPISQAQLDILVAARTQKYYDNQTKNALANKAREVRSLSRPRGARP